MNGVLVSSTNIEVARPPLPDHLSVEKGSPFYMSECFKHKIGIRFNGKERSDVKEYCVSSGWIKVPSSKTLDRKGKRVLIELKGTVEPFYKDV